MGNTCVGPSISRNGILQSVSAVMWPSKVPDDPASSAKGESGRGETNESGKDPDLVVQSRPLGQITMPKSEEKVEEPVKKEEGPAKPRVLMQIKRVASAGLKDSVLQKKTGNLKEFFSIGKKLGQGQFGTTFKCIEKASGKEYACKSIAKRKWLTDDDVEDVIWLTDDDVEDVRREIQIMHHLAGHPNVISIKGAYEDVLCWRRAFR